MSSLIVAYLSHSYRPQDRAVNMAVWKKLNEAGLAFAVDPPSDNGTRPMDITFLERMMQRSHCFVAIVPDRTYGRRSNADDGLGDGALHDIDGTWSPYQALECRLALRANKPRLLIIEKDLGFGPLPPNEPLLQSFDRSGSSLVLSSGFNTAVRNLITRARGQQVLKQEPITPMPKIGLLRWSRAEATWGKLLADLRKQLGDNNCEFIDIEDGMLDHMVLAKARLFSAVVVDMRPTVTPAYLIGLLHGASIPMYRTCLLREGETAHSWESRLGLDETELQLTFTSGQVEPAFLKGYRVDKHMQPVLFWYETTTKETACTVASTTVGYQKRERRLKTTSAAREYFLNLLGNRVFISTPGDLNEFAAVIKDSLDDAGMPAFHYKRSKMKGGLEWKEQLRTSICESDLFLGLISSSYWDRPECVDEMESAVKRWEMHQTLILLYASSPMPPLPPFLARMQVNSLGDPLRSSFSITDEVRRRFHDKAHESFDDVIQLLRGLLDYHAGATLNNPAELPAWIHKVCGLSADEALDFAKRLTSVPNKSEELVRLLLDDVQEKRFGGNALGRLCLYLKASETQSKNRKELNKLFSRLRLFPNLHDVRAWNARRLRREVQLKMLQGTPTRLFDLAAKTIGQTSKPMQFVPQLATEIGQYIQLDERPEALALPETRLCFKCSTEELAVPVEWAVKGNLGEPIGRAWPISREVINFTAQEPREPLEIHFGANNGGPPRVLLFGTATVTLPDVTTELDILSDKLQDIYVEKNWPPLLVQCEPKDSNRRPTADRLRNLVERSDFDILHLSGHAGFDGNSPVLEVAGLDDKPAYISGEQLAGWLRNSSVRFVYLSCCEGATGSLNSQQLAGWRQSLCKSMLDAGVAEVVAYFWPVGDKDSVSFVMTFYQQFFMAFDASSALHKARQSTDLDSLLWAASLLVRRATVAESEVA